MKHTWNLLVELKGISATFLFCALMLITSPRMTSENFSRAVSEASPTTTLCGHKGRKHFTFTFPQFHGMLHTSATRNLHFYVQVILEKIEFVGVCFALGVRTEPQQTVKQFWGHTQGTTGELRHKPKLIWGWCWWVNSRFVLVAQSVEFTTFKQSCGKTSIKACLPLL